MPEEFWKTFVDTVRAAYPYAAFFAEAYHNKEDLEKMGIDVVLDASFAHVLYEILRDGRAPEDLRKHVEGTPVDVQMKRAHFKDSHDVRDVEHQDPHGDERFRYLSDEEQRLALALIMTIPGVPVIFNAELEAVLGYAYHHHLINRIDWNTYDEAMRAYNERMVAFGASPLFRKGSFRFLDAKLAPNSAVFAFEREFGGEKVIVAANLANADSWVNLDVDSFIDSGNARYSVEEVFTEKRFNTLDASSGSKASRSVRRPSGGRKHFSREPLRRHSPRPRRGGRG